MENKPTKRLSWIAVLGLVVALCLVAYFLATRFASMRSNRLDQVIPISARSDQLLSPLGDGMIFYDGATLHALDGRGRPIWSYGAGAYANFDASEWGVATWTGTMLSLLPVDSGTALYSGNEGTAVISARMGKMYAAVQVMPKADINNANQSELTEHNSTIVIRDMAGRQQDRIDLPSQTVLDFGFFNNGRVFWVLSLDTEGTVPMCTIKTYTPGQALRGKIDDTEQLIYHVLFQQQKIRTVGLRYIKDFDYTSKEIVDNRILVHGWSLADMDDTDPQNPLMVFVPTTQPEGVVGVSDLRIIHGTSDIRLRLPGTATQVFAQSNTAYAFSNDRVMVLPVGANEPAIKALPLYIDNVVALTDNHSAIVSAGSSVYMIPLP